MRECTRRSSMAAGYSDDRGRGPSRPGSMTRSSSAKAVNFIESQENHTRRVSCLSFPGCAMVGTCRPPRRKSPGPRATPLPCMGQSRMIFLGGRFAILRIVLPKTRKRSQSDPGAGRRSRPRLSPDLLGGRTSGRRLDPPRSSTEAMRIPASGVIHPVDPQDFAKAGPVEGLPYCGRGRPCVSLSPCLRGRAVDRAGNRPARYPVRGIVFALWWPMTAFRRSPPEPERGPNSPSGLRPPTLVETSPGSSRKGRDVPAVDRARKDRDADGPGLP